MRPRDEPIMRRPKRRPIDLNLSLRPLDANSRFGRIEAIRVCRDAEACKGDAVGGVFAAGGRGEGEQDGGVLVSAGAVLFDGCEDGGGFAVRGGDGVVEGLEAPGEGVNADCSILRISTPKDQFS